MISREQVDWLAEVCNAEEKSWVKSNMDSFEAGRTSEKELETVIQMLIDVKKTGGGLVPAALLDTEPPPLFKPEPLIFKVEED